MPSGSLLWREILETIILTLLIFWVVNSLTGRYRIEGPSMLPTLHTGEQVLVNKMGYYFEEPDRGDIIVLRSPEGDTKNLIKRVIGLPGDTIEIRDSQVRINGVVLNEPYINSPATNRGEWVVPDNHVFVMGDNRPVSHDSRAFSYLPYEDVVGKVWAIYWPFSDAALAPHYDHSRIDAIAAERTAIAPAAVGNP